ncbi:hypothetical protein EV188_106268 [Actinomycetospora succinea]|uniref:Uncharacterized protein n=1 Tax=Actinomycetospora succinea TaxID=663603 RepID=A0A4V3D914_9PSEU|nr:hypothetical protein [Actinomycetospora succinea]TDQ54119.1 hypothetical protein EV188_106268 [Actinomycetospora succinea]
MTEPAERTDPTEGASEPGVSTQRPWIRVVTLIVLAAFVIATLVSALAL